nr:hypothetical protein [Tanacetum cinerariifolium]
VTDMTNMDKIKAKRTKPDTGMKRVQEFEAEAEAENLTQRMPHWQSPAISLADGTWQAMDGCDQRLGSQLKIEGL